MKGPYFSIIFIFCIVTVNIVLPEVFADVKGVPFQLKINQTTSLESNAIKITFLNVTSDSRCPSDVTCIWQGEAKIFVNIIKDNNDLGNFNLTSRAGAQDLAIQSFDGHSIQLVTIDPYPSSKKQILPSDYTATFIVSKTGLLSPLKQFKSGVDSKDIQCREGLRLVLKAENNTPACVMPTSAQKLADRGWALPIA